MMPFIERVRGSIKTHGMLQADETVLAAVSGGADSIALLHTLAELHGRVAVAYFDHATRDGESAEDGEFVRAQAELLGLPFHTDSIATERPAAMKSLSFEEYARDERYAFLVQTAKAQGYGAIATGHHCDDNAETVLIRLLRGTSPHGLQGILPVSERDGLRIIRPLIEVSRAEILAYVEAENLAYRKDSTNKDTRFLRNRIRHELIPLLESDYNPGLRRALNRLAEVQRSETAYMDAEARRFLDSCLNPEGNVVRARFAEAPLAIQRRALLLIAWRHGVRCEFERVDAALRFIAEGATGAYLDLGSGTQLCNGKHETRVIGETVPCLDGRPVALRIPGTVEGLGRVIATRTVSQRPTESFAEYCSPTRQVFESAVLAGGASLRRVAEGDRFRPFGVGGSKRLSEYLAEAEVPVWKRPEALVLTSGDTILWVVGHGIGEEAVVHNPAAPLMEVEIHETQP